MGYPPGAAARAQPAPLTRKRQRALRSAVGTPKPDEAVLRVSTGEEPIDSLLHEGTNANDIKNGLAARVDPVVTSLKEVMECITIGGVRTQPRPPKSHGVTPPPPDLRD